MSYADGYAGMLSMQSYYCDSEDDEAMRLLERQPAVYYCAGEGAPVVKCETVEEWRIATRRRAEPTRRLDNGRRQSNPGEDRSS